MAKPPDRQSLQSRLHELAQAQQRLAAETAQRTKDMATAAHGLHGAIADSVRQIEHTRALLRAAANRGVTATASRQAPAQASSQPARGVQGVRLASEIERAVDHERRQLARDLHDDLGQTLAALRLRLSSLHSDRRADVRRMAAELAELVTAADVATRSLAAQLVPAVLHDDGLVPALYWLAGEIRQRFGVSVTVADDAADKPLSPEVASIAYRAVRELLINVAKHAGVDRAELTLQCKDGQLVISVRDDGQGLGQAPADRPHMGLGLQGVRDRACFLGGQFRIGSLAGGGTLAELALPLETGTRPEAA
jgi:signal transduction histidine kinase